MKDYDDRLSAWRNVASAVSPRENDCNFTTTVGLTRTRKAVISAFQVQGRGYFSGPGACPSCCWLNYRET